MAFRTATSFGMLLILLLVISMPCAIAASEENKPLSIIERRMEGTVCIGTIEDVRLKESESPRKTFVPRGTGVIIEIPGDPQKRVCLVTAKHVFDDPSKNWHPQIINLRFTWHQHLPLEEYHGLALRIRQGQRKLWYEHAKADLACIPLFIPANIIGKEYVSAVTISEMLEPRDLVVGQPVTVLGFPGAVGGSLGSSFMTLPLARRGLISWLPTSEKMPRAILVDTMAFPGNSGGPVFNEPRKWDEFGKPINKPQPAGFIGIVSKAAIQPVEIKAVQTRGITTKVFKPMSLDYMGLTQIEPADRVRELLELVKKEIIRKTEQGHGH